MRKQAGPYGCGLYAVANALNLDNFITEERLNFSKDHGNTIGQLSKWLQEDGNDFAIDVLYYNHVGEKLPEEALSYTPESNDYLPVLINVQYSEKGKRHLVGGLIDNKGVLILIDSLSSDIEVTTMKEVNEKYKRVFGLFIFMDAMTGDYVFFNV